jgi:hypothetical protein
MRFAAALLLSATCLVTGNAGYSQDPCSGRPLSPKPGEQPLTVAQLAHQAFLETTSETRPRLALGDVEAIVKCGMQQDAEELFATMRDTSVQASGFTVVEADRNSICVFWDDGFKPNLAAFRFHFDQPLPALPHPGDRIRISGNYSPYSREPLQINMTNASFVMLHP